MSPHDRASGATSAAGLVVGVAAGLVLLAGLYLILAPWIAHFGGAADLAVSNTVTGLALVALAVARTMNSRVGPLTWVVPVLGVWAALSPLFLRHAWETQPSTAAWVGNIVAGAVVVLGGLAMLKRR